VPNPSAERIVSNVAPSAPFIVIPSAIDAPSGERTTLARESVAAVRAASSRPKPIEASMTASSLTVSASPASMFRSMVEPLALPFPPSVPQPDASIAATTRAQARIPFAANIRRLLEASRRPSLGHSLGVFVSIMRRYVGESYRPWLVGAPSAPDRPAARLPVFGTRSAASPRSDAPAERDAEDERIDL